MTEANDPTIYLPAIIEEEFYNKHNEKLAELFEGSLLPEKMTIYVHADAFAYGSFTTKLLYDYFVALGFEERIHDYSLGTGAKVIPKQPWEKSPKKSGKNAK